MAEIRPPPGPKRSIMKPVTGTAARRDRFFALVLPISLMSTAAACPANAAGCTFEPQGEGRVAAIIDARSFRLEDGREVILAGIDRSWPIRKKAAAHRL